MGLNLSDVAAAGLAALDDFHGPDTDDVRWSALAAFDAGYPEPERFPRQLTVALRQHENDRGQHVVTTTLRPNALLEPAGDQSEQPLGDPLTDNAHQPDGYRFHDAIHLGFLAVLNWSPNLRALLRRKRKSDPAVDECEDGARAVFAEEGLAAVLARLATDHNEFGTYEAVPRDAVAIARAATVGLEVHIVPGWLWRRAIWQGFAAMRQLTRHSGGTLVADLDARTLTYQKPAVPPVR
ncbi:hypothetical protein SAMN06264365_12812 [Actinoplanes regularis]|uniref:MazG C-terminal domain-containing protein n=1 Tax=Actinoplanes regularis TaxID=52697 RepID=A0A239ICZ6_9ACTN|nr:hypothetical protein SAMN06264365_12812 [Actinoplanes regularis]